MLAAERRQKIADQAMLEKRVLVSELAQMYKVTEETIRRDLEKLEKEGIVNRTYGGAIVTRQSSEDLPFATRNATNQDIKMKIAFKALDLIQDGDTLMIDPSSTAYELLKQLNKKQNLTVITNSVEALHELAGQDIQLISTGGTLRNRSLSLIGPVAQDTVQKYHVDKVIISCKAISTEKGVMDSNEPECELKKRMIQQGSQVILLVDHTKFDKASFVQLSDLEQIHVLVTDDKPSDDWLAKLAELGIEVIY